MQLKKDYNLDALTLVSFNSFFSFAYYFFVCFLTFYPKYELNSPSTAGIFLALLFVGNITSEPFASVPIEQGKGKNVIKISILLATGAIFTLIANPKLYLFYISAFAMGAVSGSIRPYVYSKVKDLENYVALNSNLMSIERVSMILGIGLGLFIYQTIGQNSLLLIVFAFLGFSFLFCLLHFKYTKTKKTINKETINEGFFKELKKGFLFVKNTKPIKSMFLLLMFLNMFYPPLISIALPYLIEDSLSLTFEWISFVSIIQGISVIIGTQLLKTRVSDQSKRKHWFSIGMFCLGLGVILLTSSIKIFIILGSILTGLGLSSTRLNSIIQLQDITPKQYLARTVGLLTVVASAVVPIGMYIFGVLVELLNKEVIILNYIVGIVLILSTILINKWSNLKNFFKPDIIIASTISISVFLSFKTIAFEYTRPIPEIPSFTDPSQISDIVNCSLAQHIHGTIFRIGLDGRPYPFLIENFKVSNKGKTYSFIFKEDKLKNGQELTSRIAKKSLENAIENKAVNYLEFYSVQGFKDFIEKKTNNISGFKIIDKKTLGIHLEEPNTNLVKVLSDVRFSIWDIENKETAQGFGLYNLKRSTSKTISLEKRKILNSHLRLPFPSLFNFTKLNKEEALLKFKENKVDDLLLYSLGRSEVRELSKFATSIPLLTPRTYGVFLNSRNITTKSKRKELIDRISGKNLIKSCYSEEIKSENLIPKGFLGHIDKIKTRQSQKYNKQSKDKLSIAVLNIIHNKKCVFDYLTKKFPKSIVQYMNLDKFLEKWNKSELDVFVAYIDAENTDGLFGDFTRDSSLKLGDVKDMKLEKYHRLYIKEKNKTTKMKMAPKLSKMIIEGETVLPLFHPRFVGLFSKRISPSRFPFKSPCFIPTEGLKLSRKEN